MGIRAAIERVMGRGSMRGLSLMDQAGWTDWISIGGSAKTAGVPGSARPAETVIGVHAALTARVRTIAKVPLRITDGGDNIIEGGDLQALLSRPNPYMDGNAYIGRIETYLALYDMCLVAIVGDGVRPDELLPLDPRKCQPIEAMHSGTGARVVAGWRYIDVGGAHVLASDNVIPIVGNNPYAIGVGLESVKAARLAIAQDIATRNSNLELYTNGCAPDLVLTHPSRLDRDQARELLDQFEARHKGSGRRHRTALAAGGLGIEKLGLNPEEMQAMEGLKLSLQDIRMALQVMPAMMMIMEGETGLSQGSSTRDQMVAWWNNVGLSELDRIARAHQRYLVDRWSWSARRARPARLAERLSLRQRRQAGTSSLSLWFDDNAVEELVEYRRQRIDQMDKLLARGWAPDDINDYLDLGLPPHPTNVGTLPYSVMAVGTLSVGGEGAGEGEVTTKHSKGAKGDGGKGSDSLDVIERAIARSGMGRADAGDYAGLQGMWDRWRAAHEGLAASRYSRHYLEQRTRVLGRIEEMTGDVIAAHDSDTLLAAVMPRDAEDAALLKLAGPLITDLWTGVREAAAGEFGRTPFEMDDKRVMAALESWKVNATKINDTTAADIKGILQAGLESGATQEQLSEEIADYYKTNAVGPTKARPMTAARTQVAGIINHARMIAAEGGDLKKAWLHGGSAVPRPEHINAQERYMAAPIALTEKFMVNGIAMNQPGDPAAPISETANCTCMVVFVKPDGQGQSEGEG